MTVLLDSKTKEIVLGGACGIGEQNEKWMKYFVQKT